MGDPNREARFNKLAENNTIDPPVATLKLYRKAICRVDGHKKLEMIIGKNDWNVVSGREVYRNDFLREQYITFIPKFPGPIPLTIKFSSKVEAKSYTYEDGVYKYKEFKCADRFDFDVAFLNRYSPFFLTLNY